VSLRKRERSYGNFLTKEKVSTGTSITRNQTLMLTKCKAGSAVMSGFCRTLILRCDRYVDLSHSTREEVARWAEVETRLKHGKALYEAAE
jgi:hypothetical protein